MPERHFPGADQGFHAPGLSKKKPPVRAACKSPRKDVVGIFQNPDGLNLHSIRRDFRNCDSSTGVTLSGLLILRYPTNRGGEVGFYQKKDIFVAGSEKSGKA